MPLQAIKTASSKRGKIAIFAKGLTHGFGPRLAISQSFFQELQSRKMCFTIFQNKKTPFQPIKTASSKSGKNCDFCKGVNPWFWFKIGHFSIFCFQDLQDRKMCLTTFQNEKTPFQAIRTASSKSGKIAIFAKGLNPWFLSKIGHFSVFCFQVIQGRKMCFTIFQNEQTPFQALKTASSKSEKIEIFAKGLTHGFCPKLAIFPSFVFRQYQPGKCVLRYSTTKKRLSRL